MTNNIHYSFIIPHKNTPELLQKCLDSIPQRNDIEVIIVDNNSSPDTVDFKKYPGWNKNNVTIVYDNDSISAGGARNTGLKIAKGKWVLFADADDYYSNDFINKLDEFVDLSIDVVYFNFMVMQDGKELPYPYGLRYFNDFKHDEEFIDMMRFRFAAPWNKMLNREFIIKNHIEFEDCITGNDVFFSYQVGFFAQNVVADEFKLYNYVINGNSNNHRRDNKNDFYKCLFKHYYQSNEFLGFVGHVEWKFKFCEKFIAILYKRGIGQFWLAVKVFLLNNQELVNNKNFYVDSINSRKR